MVKRVVLTKDKFRISAPGVDVDTAGDHEFILHESHLSAQPYWVKWVDCPFAGAGTGAYDVSVGITVPSEADSENSSSILIPRGATGYNYFPHLLTFTGSFPTQFADVWSVSVTGDPPNLQVRFIKSENSSAPLGAWLMLLRKQ